MHSYLCTYIHIHTYVHVHTYVHTHTHLHTHTHTHTHTYTHTYTPAMHIIQIKNSPHCGQHCPGGIAVFTPGAHVGKAHSTVYTTMND